MEIKTFKCDVCGKLKGETNHWFVMRWAPLINSDPRATVKTGTQLTLAGFEWRGLLIQTGEMHLCGEKCVLQKVSQFMLEKSEKPA